MSNLVICNTQNVSAKIKTTLRSKISHVRKSRTKFFLSKKTRVVNILHGKVREKTNKFNFIVLLLFEHLTIFTFHITTSCAMCLEILFIVLELDRTFGGAYGSHPENNKIV